MLKFKLKIFYHGITTKLQKYFISEQPLKKYLTMNYKKNIFLAFNQQKKMLLIIKTFIHLDLTDGG